MIIYGGVDMTEVAPVKIDDIAVSPIQLSPVSRQRATAFGADFVRMGGSTRKITVTFALLQSNLQTREASMQAIRDWAYKSTETALVLPWDSTKHLECIVTQMPDTSHRKWWENKLILEFTCYSNPFWTSETLKEAACGVSFTVAGSAPPIMTIERNEETALTNAAYTSGAQTMTFTTIPSGEFVLDLNRQTASIDGVSAMQYYVPTSTWITPHAGTMQIIGYGTIKYRERWV